MVLKNKNLQKLEKVANRTPHYGIRKLTIGAASVLLGTTLWLGKDAVLAQAADQTNASEGSNDAKAVTESDKSADSSVDANTKVIVDSSKATDSSAAVSTDKSSSAVVSQKGADKNQNITGNVSDSEKTNIENNQTSSAAKQSSSQSSIAQNKADTDNATASQKQVSPAARADNAIKQQAQSIQSKLSESRNDIAANAQSKLGLNTNLTATQQAQKSIQQAGNQGKVDLNNLDLTKGINAAANKTDANLGAKNVLGNKLALKANASNSSAVLQNNTNDSNNVDSNKSGASLVGGANVSANDGQNADTGKINKVVVAQENKDQATSILSQGNDALIAAAKESATELFDKKASSFAAPAALLASLAEEPSDSDNTQTTDVQKEVAKEVAAQTAKDAKKFNTVTDWAGVQNALNTNADGVTISGNITADSDLDIASGKKFIIVGADKNATLTLGNHAINNDGDLTLERVTVNGSIVGQGTVDIKDTVTSNVDSSNQKTLTNSQLNEQISTTRPGANTSNWKAANIEASRVNVDFGSTLNVNRSITGDGIALVGGASHYVDDGSTFGTTQATNDKGTIDVDLNAKLNINLKDAQNATRANEQANSLDNANSGIRAIDNGHFITGDSAQVTINAGHGRAINFGEPFGGTNSVELPSDPMNNWYNNRWVRRDSSYARTSNNTVILGDSTKMNITGRDGILMGNRANFTTGNHSIVHIDGKGNGAGLLGDAFSSVEVSPQSQLLLTSDGKDDSGAYAGGNFIGLGENGQFRVEHDATFRYKLINRKGWTDGHNNQFDDNMNIISVNTSAHPEVYVGPDATFDGQSDYDDYYGEIFAFPVPDGARGVFQIDGAKYVNWEKNADIYAHDGHGNLYYGTSSIIDATSNKDRTYFVFKWNSKNLNDNNYTFDDSSASAIHDSIQNFENSSDEYWRNVKHLATTYSKAASLTDEHPGHVVSSEDINGDATPGQKHGNPLNKFDGPTNGQGFNPEDSQRLVLVATTIPSQVDQSQQQVLNHKIQIVYDQNLKSGQVELVQKGQDGLQRITHTTYYNIDASSGKRTLDTTKGTNGESTTTTILQEAKDEIIHVGPQTATINYLEKDGNNAATPIKDASGNNIVGTATGAPIVANSDGSIEFDDQGNTTPEKIKYNDGKVLSSDSTDLQRAEQAAGSDYKYDINRDDWSQAVNLGTNVYDNQGLTRSAIVAAAEKLQEGQTVQLGAKQGPTYNVVLFKSEHVAQNVEQVSITQKIQRAISYKNNKDRQNISDPNGADRNTAAGLDDMSKSLLHGEAKDEQSITLKGIAYLDTSTGKFVNVKTQDGHPVDANGNYIALDDNGNAVIGDLQSDGTVKARLTDGKTTLTNYVVDGDRQGTFKWSLDTSNAAGFTSPTADHYTVNPSSVPALDGSIKTTATFVKDAQGNTISNPTLQQVVDYLNNESAQDALQQAVSQDVIKDASDYPQMPQVPSTQYIFDQYQLTNNDGMANNNNYIKWNYVVTLAVDRDNPTGPIHVYVTSPDYRQTYMSRTAEVNNADDPVLFSSSVNGDQFTIRVYNWGGQNGDSTSIDVNHGFGFIRTFGYGARDTDTSYVWGDYKPREITQTVNYIDEKTDKPIEGYPSIKVTGLIGQHFDASGVNKLNIPGYTFDAKHSDTPSGSISDYQVGRTYTRTWYTTWDGQNYKITENHKLISADGTMDTVVYVNGHRYEDTIAPNGYMTAGSFQIQNPWVKPTTTVNLRYTENPVTIDQNQTPYYVVYTPNAKGTVNVIFHDTTTNTDITGYGPKTPLTGDEGTDVTGYTPNTDITTLEGKGYVLDTTSPIPTGDLSSMPAKYTNGNQTVYINLKHGLEDVNKNNPHNFDVDRTVTRQINYTINGQPTTQLTGHTQSAEFERTGHWDKVDKKLVDVVNGQIVTENGQTVDGHLSDWKVASGSNSDFKGFDKPTLAGYHVDSVTADPTTALNDNAVASGDNEGQVKEVTATADYGNVTVTIDLTKDAAEKANLKIVDDTTGQTLNDGITAEGDENTPISFATGESTVQGYLNNHYRFVSVVNDADPSSPLSTTSYTDGAAKFGNYDTDPNKDQGFTVHLVHIIDRIDKNNPHGQKVTATVTRNVNYTVDGLPDSSLPSHTETAKFNATGYYDEVTNKVVDLVNGTTIEQGKVILHNGNEADGHLTWTVDGGTADSSTLTGYAVPTKDGYHVNGVTVDPAADKDANADDTGLVKDLTVNHESHDVTITINLTKDAVKDVQDIVNYIDDTTGKTLRTDTGSALKTLTGKPNDNVTYTTADIIKGYTDQGYRLVSNDFNDGHETFGSTGKTYNVHLAHRVIDIDKNTPNVHNMMATVTRQINYTVNGVPDSSLPSHTETANFSATGHYDLVEHKIVDMVNGQEKVTNGQVDDGHLIWTVDGGSQDSSTFTGYAIPTKKGYHVNNVTVVPVADKAVNADDTGLVHELTVSHNSHDVTININLTNDAPQADVEDIVNYIDDTTGQTLRTDNGNVINTLTGKPNGQVTYTTGDIIKGYESQGYRLVSNDFKDGHEVFGNNGHTYNVHLAHKVETFTGDNPYGINAKATVTRQVNYTVDGVADSTLPSHTETVNFSATGHYDLVEHKVVDMVNGKESVTNGHVDDGHLVWTVDGGSQDSSTLTGYAVPTKAGYHVNSVTVDPAADKDANADDTGLVKDLSVNHNSHNVTININLTKNAPAANVADIVNYIDDTTGQTLRTDNGNVINTLTGKPNSQVTYTTAGIIKGYTDQGYRLVSNDFNDGHEVFGNTGHTYNVHLAHQVVVIDKNNPYGNPVTASVTRQVNYTVDGVPDSTLPSHTETANFSATGHYDLVEHKVVDMVNGQEKVTNGKVDDGHLTWTVDGGSQDSSTLTGYAIPTKAGYHVDNVMVNPSADKAANADDTGLVKDLNVNHNSHNVTVTINLTKNGQTTKNERDINTKATVHYVIEGDDANKPAAPADNVQDNFQFHYSGDIYDANTGDLISKGQWTTGTSHAYNAVTSPTIKGYHTETTVVPSSSLTVTTDNPTVEITVRYVKDGTTVRNQQTVTASQKVEYQDDQGNTLSPEKDQNFTFNYTGDTYDAVTGDLISRGHWNVASHNFTGENVPVINGYVAVSGYTKNGDSYTAGGFDTVPTASDAERNRTFIVVYKKTSVIVPVYPNHNPIPNVPNPQYPNDPKNPTNVTPNEPVPKIPGYTPETPTVTPTDPTKPTEVVYTRDQVAQVVYRDVNDPQNIITLDTDGNLTGKAGDAVKDDQVPTKISNFEEKGYVLVSNGFTNPVFDDVAGNTQTFYVDFKHQTTTVTPDKPGHPGQPVNPDNPNGPKYPTGTDINQVKRTGTQTIHYQGAGDKTPADNKQSFDFTRTITFDDVTGKIITTTPWNVSSHTFGNVDTPVVPGYHADKGTAGGTTITPDDLTKTVVVTYSPNGKIVPVDPNHNPIPSAPTPQYPTDPKNPTNVTPNEPVPTVPGYTPTQPTVTPTDPGKDTPVVYVKDQVAQVIYQDINDPQHIVTLGTDTGLTGKAGDAIKDDQVPTKIQDFENEGYVLVSNGFTGAVFDDVADNTQTFYVTFKHGTVTINPKNPGKPGQPINPNDPNGPKWGEDTDTKHLTEDGTQTIHYTGAGNNTPKDNVQTTTFNHEEVIDKVTGKVVADHGWTPGSHTFGSVDTPVVNGYHADRTTAGGATVTPDKPNATIVVTYSPNGKIIPVDPNGKPIPNVPQPQYPTDPKNPTAVTPNEPVPTIKGYTPSQNTVTPTDPGKDTPVVYNPVTPKEVQGKQTVTFVDQNGKQLHDPSVTNHTFTKPGESFTYGNVTVPVIPGYVASKKTAGGKTGTYENPNVTDQIVYTKIGKIVPVDNNGNPIPNASQPIYNNDPKDPTKVVPNEAVPSVPGYTVDQNQTTPGFNKDTDTVTPVDPTKDTKVVYTKQPNEPDNPQGPDQPTQPTTAPSQPTIAPVHPENPTQPTNAPSQPTNAPQPSNIPPHAQPNPTEPSPAPEPAPIKPKAQKNPVVPTVNNVQPKSQTYVPAQNAAAPKETAAPSDQQLPQTGENDNSIAAALAGGVAVSLSLIGLVGVRKRRRD